MPYQDQICYMKVYHILQNNLGDFRMSLKFLDLSRAANELAA